MGSPLILFEEAYAVGLSLRLRRYRLRDLFGLGLVCLQLVRWHQFVVRQPGKVISRLDP